MLNFYFYLISKKKKQNAVHKNKISRLYCDRVYYCIFLHALNFCSASIATGIENRRFPFNALTLKHKYRCPKPHPFILRRYIYKHTQLNFKNTQKKKKFIPHLFAKLLVYIFFCFCKKPKTEFVQRNHTFSFHFQSLCAK